LGHGAFLGRIETCGAFPKSKTFDTPLMCSAPNIRQNE
jgi:hypothetical protein